MHSKIESEKRIVAVMIKIYCHAHHHKKTICTECEALLNYAQARLEHCPFGEAKNSCRKCPIHCYTPSRREEMRRVMRYSGPRMLLLHPAVYIKHVLHR